MKTAAFALSLMLVPALAGAAKTLPGAIKHELRLQGFKNVTNVELRSHDYDGFRFRAKAQQLDGKAGTVTGWFKPGSNAAGTWVGWVNHFNFR